MWFFKARTKFGYPAPTALGHKYWRVYINSNASGNFTACNEIQWCWNGAYQTNAMTANNTGTIGGLTCTVNQSDVSNTAYAWIAFDGNTGGNYYWNSANISPPHWISSTFPTPVNITGMKWTTSVTPNYIPSNFAIQWSDDNNSWTSVWSGGTGMDSTSTTYEFSWTGYRYYRYYVSSSSSPVPNVQEINLQWNGAWQTNAKTGNAAGSGKIGLLPVTLSGAQYSGSISWGFDGSDASEYLQGYGMPTSNTLDFGSNPVYINGMKLLCSSTNTFYFQASSDNSTWITLAGPLTNTAGVRGTWTW